MPVRSECCSGFKNGSRSDSKARSGSAAEPCRRRGNFGKVGGSAERCRQLAPRTRLPRPTAERLKTTLNAFRLTRGRNLFLAPLLCLAACGASESETSSNAFKLSTSQYGVASTTPLAVQGDWIAFLADEAASGATPLNTYDTDVNDEVAIVINTATKTEINLRVAARELRWLGTELYLVVDEILDNHDWDGSTAIAELVLLRWNVTLPDPVLVDVLDRNSPVAITSVGDTLFYASGHLTVLAMESSFRAISLLTPNLPRNVFTKDTLGGLTPRLLGEQNGLIFLGLDETVFGDSRDLNGDGFANDTTVLALLDGEGTAEPSGYTLEIRNTGLAIENPASPLRAISRGSHDWLVAFLVNEMAQELSLNRFGGGNPLPQSWQVSTCGVDDVDLDDDVLHAIRFKAWDLDPMTEMPINTGLAGGQRVLIADDAVGTICLESDEGPCIFNNDGDSTDSMLRWMRIDGPMPLGSTAGPARSVSQLLALDTSLAGPALAVAELDGAFVIQCDEVADGRNWDANLSTNRNLVAWLDPQDTSPSWRFNHGTSSASYTTATWMGELPGRTRLGIAYAESSNSSFLNPDGDQNDSVPTFADLLPTVPKRLGFPGYGVALDPGNAGISLANGWGFFRVSEVEEGADINANGQSDDILLVRLNLTNGAIAHMSALNLLARPSVETEPDGISVSGAYLFDEMIFGLNVSGDNDPNDLVVRYFRLP